MGDKIKSKSIYWDIRTLLPYQRNFNFINAERSVGKTYSTQKFLIKSAKEKFREFIYLVRTQDEKKSGVFEESFKKVIAKEFPNDTFRFTKDEMFLVKLDEDGEMETEILLGYCIALSEAVKVKRKSYPLVFYIMLDEYMLEGKHQSQYVNGWNEPDLLLSIYHTVDREEDRVMCFLLGNNTSFYNPYHMHKAFNIPMIEKGSIWKSENVLFAWVTSSQALKEQKSKSKFLRMIEPTNYGKYAKEGDYVDDNVNFIQKMTTTARYSMTFEYEGNSFGVYNDLRNGAIYVSDKVDPSCKLIYALTVEDHKENTLLTKSNQVTQLRWLAHNFKLGNVRFVSMEVKVKCEKAIALLL